MNARSILPLAAALALALPGTAAAKPALPAHGEVLASNPYEGTIDLLVREGRTWTVRTFDISQADVQVSLDVNLDGVTDAFDIRPGDSARVAGRDFVRSVRVRSMGVEEEAPPT